MTQHLCFHYQLSSSEISLGKLYLGLKQTKICVFTLFFRNHSQSDEEDSFNGVSINGNMRFLCTDSTSVVIEKLRDRLNQILEWKVSHPAFVDWGRDTSETKILR